MTDPAQDGELISHFGKLGKVLTKANTRDISLNFLKLTAVRIRCVWLKIKGIHVRGATSQSNKNC